MPPHWPQIRLSLRWQILLACMLPVLLMAGSLALRTRAVEEAAAKTDGVTHSNEVIGAANGLLKTIVDAQTGQRGFLLTRDPAFLAPYETATSTFWTRHAELSHLVRDNDAQGERLARVSRTFQQWLRDIAEPSLRERATSLPLENQGKTLIDGIRVTVSELVDAESRLLRVRTEQAAASIAWFRRVSVVGGLSTILVALAIAVYLATSIGRAIAELDSAAAGISQGILNRRAHVPRMDELGRLAAAFNSMVEALERRNREAFALSALGENLQACVTLAEATKAFSRFARQELTGTSGAVYLTSASRDLLTRVVDWGEPGVETLAAADCWCLRKGHAHHVEDLASGNRCAHLAEDGTGSSLCIPLMAHGESTGLLHLLQPGGKLSEGTRTFIGSLTEQLALAFANLRLRERLEEQSTRDPLTGLFNRRYLDATLPREMARAERSNHPLGVFAIDVDHFKRFNDTFGHEAGDTVLRELGQLIRTSFRAGDIGARLGGEEFVVVLPETDRERLTRLAERLRASVAALTLSHQGTPLGPITVSVGVALFPDTGKDPRALLGTADAALYRAKREGRDRVVVAEPRPQAPVLASLPPSRPRN